MKSEIKRIAKPIISPVKTNKGPELDKSSNNCGFNLTDNNTPAITGSNVIK